MLTAASRYHRFLVQVRVTARSLELPTRAARRRHRGRKPAAHRPDARAPTPARHTTAATRETLVAARRAAAGGSTARLLPAGVAPVRPAMPAKAGPLPRRRRRPVRRTRPSRSEEHTSEL